MACRCAERRAAIVEAAKRPTTVLTAVGFVAKTSIEDVSAVTAEGLRRISQHLSLRRVSPRNKL